MKQEKKSEKPAEVVATTETVTPAEIAVSTETVSATVETAAPAPETPAA